MTGLTGDYRAVRFPELTVVNVHGGWPYAQAALGVAFAAPTSGCSPTCTSRACRARRIT